jgi:hypothetical protein
MTATAFANIGRNEWLLSAEIEVARRALLHNSLVFEAIVQKLSHEAKVVEVHRNRAKCFPGYFRVHVKIRVSTDTCTMFYSGRSGYRAQYYLSIANGERANAFAVSTLAQAIRPQLNDARQMSKGWIEQSLSGRASKVWIHQGRWVRHERNSDRMLRVARWIRELAATDERRRKLALWGSLIPRGEDRIDIKGTFMTLDGQPLTANPKIGRNTDLHNFGFT